MKTKRVCLASMLALAMIVMVSCGGSSSKKMGNGVFKPLIDVYLEINQKYAENVDYCQKMNKSKAVSKEEFTNYTRGFMSELKALKEKAKEVASTLVGKDIPCTASPESGITVSEGKIKSCSWQDDRVVVEMQASAPGSGSCYMFWLDENDNIVSKTLGRYSEKEPAKIITSLHISVFGVGMGDVDKNLDKARQTLMLQSRYTKLMVVSKNEYNAECANASGEAAEPEPEAETAEATSEP